MSASKGLRLTVSVKLSSVVGSRWSPCASWESLRFFRLEKSSASGRTSIRRTAASRLEMNVSVSIERAIAAVQSAPSELNLDAFKSKQAHLHTLLDDAKKALNQTLPATPRPTSRSAAPRLSPRWENSKTRRRRCSTSPLRLLSLKPSRRFHQQCAPAEAAVREALKQFREAADRTNVAKTAVIESTTTTMTWTAAGLAGFLVLALAVLAYADFARSVVLPLRALTSAMRDLAEGNFGMVLPGLGRKDEIGDMAQAVETFKVRAEQKARGDAEAKMKQDQAAAQQRKRTWSSSPTTSKARSAGSSKPYPRPRPAGGLSRHADHDGRAGAGTHHHGRGGFRASFHQRAVGGLRHRGNGLVHQRDQSSGAGIGTDGQRRGRPGPHHQRSRQRVVKGRRPDRRRGRADQHHRRPDQPAGAQCDHRSGARRRGGPRLCGGCLRSQGARRADRESDRRDRPADHRHPVRDAGVGRRDQGNLGTIESCRKFPRRLRRPWKSRVPPRRKFPATCSRQPKVPSRSPRTSPTCSAEPARPDQPRPKFSPRRNRYPAIPTA